MLLRLLITFLILAAPIMAADPAIFVQPDGTMLFYEDGGGTPDFVVPASRVMYPPTGSPKPPNNPDPEPPEDPDPDNPDPDPSDFRQEVKGWCMMGVDAQGLFRLLLNAFKVPLLEQDRPDADVGLGQIRVDTQSGSIVRKAAVFFVIIEFRP